MQNATEHPWIAGSLSIRRSILEQVQEEARAAYLRGEESCGLLVGPAEQPLLLDGVVPMENRANKLHALDPETYPRTGRTYFDINPVRFERELRDRAAAGHPVKVLYHSHLDVGAYFSDTDAQVATVGGEVPAHDLAYLVTSVRGGASGPVVDDRKLFIWDTEQRRFVVTPLAVVDG